MSRMLVLALMVLVSGIGFAQTAEEYCSAEKAEGESCYQQCCASLGYTWSGGGCNVADADIPYLDQQCGYCTETFIQCRDYYEGVLSSGGGPSVYDAGYPSGPTSAGGCCAGFALLAAFAGLFSLRR